MEEKLKVMITNIQDSPDYFKKGYNSEQIVNVSNTSSGQEDQNTGQSQADGKNEGK